MTKLDLRVAKVDFRVTKLDLRVAKLDFATEKRSLAASKLISVSVVWSCSSEFFLAESWVKSRNLALDLAKSRSADRSASGFLPSNPEQSLCARLNAGKRTSIMAVNQPSAM